jgi:hypothetical protein
MTLCREGPFMILYNNLQDDYKTHHCDVAFILAVGTSRRQLAPFWNESPTDLDNVIII